MDKRKPLVISLREVATVLVKHQKVHEGHWGLFVRFGIGATNIQNPDDLSDIKPAAIVPILELGIQPFAEPNPLTVDASEVNPRRQARKRPAK